MIAVELGMIFYVIAPKAFVIQPILIVIPSCPTRTGLISTETICDLLVLLPL